MTTSSIAGPAAGPRATGAPARQATASRLRRTSQVVLVLGTVLAVGAAFGPAWLARVGVGVAVAAAVVACLFAWREVFGARRQHAQEVLRASQRHGQALREERTRNAGVVDILTRRAGEAGLVIEGQRTVIVTLRAEVAGLHAEQEGLLTQLAQRDTTITSLRRTVGARQAELAALRDAVAAADSDAGSGAAVRHMPRRALAEHESTWSEVPGADEVWRDGSHPSVVDLRMLDTAMVLPNYEADRRVG